jgi:hypothetical protein
VQEKRFKQEGFLLGSGSPSGSDVHVSSSGIVQNHAYSLLQVSKTFLVLFSNTIFYIAENVMSLE